MWPKRLDLNNRPANSENWHCELLAKPAKIVAKCQ